MSKNRKKELWAKLQRAISLNLPSFRVYKEKSPYIWNGELVLFSSELIHPKFAFLIVTPDKKGYGKFTVELAWSGTAEFPALMQRPSGVPSQNEEMLKREKAAVRLFGISDPDGEDWLDINSSNEDSLVEAVVEAIRKFGVPYLLRVGAV